MIRPATVRASVIAACLLIPASTTLAESSSSRGAGRSLANRSLDWPTSDQWRRVFLLEDYNSRVVILGTLLLGLAGGVVGSFTLLRKRALMGDALSHAALPGIGLAFLVATALGFSGKSLPILLLGATLSGLFGVVTILLIRNLTRLKEDAALGIVLSVFFGAGISLLGVVQQMESGHAAGLEAFIYGKTASMGANDALLIAGAALTCSVTCLLLFKELKLLCFDEGFAGARGVPVVLLDSILMALVVVVSIVGLQAVGLILMIALLVIPAAAARFWTEKMGRMTVIAGVLGAAGGMVGAATSALFSKLPSGAMIVLVCTAFFLFSLVFGSARGVLVRWIRRHRLNRKIDRQHLLRAMYETLEASSGTASADAVATRPVALTDLLSKRSWSSRRLRSGIRRAERLGLVEWHDAERVALTQTGLEEAVRMTHQHRLWELYLINYADSAPSHVDRDADALEHVLEPEVISRLESLLKQRRSLEGIPDSPHDLIAAAAPTVSQVDGR